MSTLHIKSCTNKHMFRHQSEIKKQKKGGYLESKICLGLDCPDNCMIQLSLAKASFDTDVIPQPSLLHLTMKKKTRRRKRSGEINVPCDETYISKKEWRVLLQKKGSVLYPLNLDQNCLFPESAPIEGALQMTDEGPILQLGGNKVMLQIITPKQKRGEGESEIIISDVIQEIRIDGSYLVKPNVTDKVMSTDMNQVRLRVQLFDIRQNNEWVILGDVTSGSISNSKSPRFAPVQIRSVFGCKSYCEASNNSKLCVVLKQKPDNIGVKFLCVCKATEEVLELTGLKEPSILKEESEGPALSIRIPGQEPGIYKNVQEVNCNLMLCLYKGDGDNYMESTARIPIVYESHQNRHCCLCEQERNQLSYTAQVEVKPVLTAKRKKPNNMKNFPNMMSPSSESGFSSASYSTQHQNDILQELLSESGNSPLYQDPNTASTITMTHPDINFESALIGPTSLDTLDLESITMATDSIKKSVAKNSTRDTDKVGILGISAGAGAAVASPKNNKDEDGDDTAEEDETVSDDDEEDVEEVDPVPQATIDARIRSIRNIKMRA